jgi:integrase
MLNIYRLHTEQCIENRKLPKEARYDRSYRRCQCPIHVEGMIGGKMIRRGLKTSNWQRATQAINEAEARGTWEAPEARPQSQGPTIEEAIEKFLLDARSRLRPPTIKKYEVLLKRERNAAPGRFDPGKHSPTLSEFAASRALQILSEINVETMREFRQLWKDGHVAGTKKLERLRSFLGFCVDNEWITKNPASAVKVPEPTEEEQCPTLPFEDDELRRIYDGLPKYAAERHEASRGRAVDSDHLQRFEVLIRLMEHSGLAIGDATRLDTSRVVEDRLFLRRMKTGTRVYVPLPPFVVGALQSLALYKGKYYFWTGEGLPETPASNFRRTLRKLCKYANVADGHPHRFRDTFAVRLLRESVPLERVSKLLGHKSIKITEQHYWPWVQALQTQLEEDVRRAWTAAPSRPQKLAVIEGGKKAG